MQLTYKGLKDKAAWEKAGVALPGYDVEAVSKKTLENPTWLHFGAGNIFRGYIAALADKLLSDGGADTGIIAVESFDFDIIHKIYEPHDSLTLLVTLRASGAMEKSIIGSLAKGFATDTGMDALRGFFANPSLQMVSFTITEKGYALRGIDGELMPVVKADMEAGPAAPKHVMAIIAALLLKRFEAGAHPISLVSMDNCSHNGDKLRASVLEIAKAWQANGLAGADFVAYASDEARVAFPWSMIDKITPRPAESVQAMLESDGIESMAPVQTPKGTFIAPFVNAEAAQYLVIEDAFPNGRPALEKSGVYFTSRDTVNMVERMKVTTCLNPLHTAMSVIGCVLGYDSISAEMKDEEIVKLVRRIGYDEGLPVVTDPGILNPRDFIDEVIGERLPNPFIPDTPQRIATDSSQKVGIRFGETIKSYMAADSLSVNSLIGIPLAIAGWIRYLLGTDDSLAPMAVSNDPMLSELQAALAGIEAGKPDTLTSQLSPILSNAALFGVDLYKAGLGEKIEGLFREMLAGKGAVRATLKKYL